MEYSPGKIGSILKMSVSCVKEMAQWLRALIALVEDLSSVPKIYMMAHNL